MDSRKRSTPEEIAAAALKLYLKKVDASERSRDHFIDSVVKAVKKAKGRER